VSISTKNDLIHSKYAEVRSAQSAITNTREMDISFETVALLSTAFGILIYVTIKRLIFLSKLPPGNNGVIHKLVHDSIKGCKH
jgi:hypothetical protein